MLAARRLGLLAAVLSLGFAVPGRAASLAVGEKLAPFTLELADGSELDLAALAGRKAYVLAFVSTGCPVSAAYDARLAAFATEYAARRIAVVGLRSSAEGRAGLAEQARSLGFPVGLDAGSAKADALGVQFVPEVFVFDADFTLRYRGRIDDDPSGSAVPAADLRAAADAVLAGREVRLKQTKAFGCVLRRTATREGTR